MNTFWVALRRAFLAAASRAGGTAAVQNEPDGSDLVGGRNPENGTRSSSMSRAIDLAGVRGGRGKE